MKRITFFLFLSLICLFLSAEVIDLANATDDQVVIVQVPVSPQVDAAKFKVKDLANDDGTALELTWNVEEESVSKIIIYRVEGDIERKLTESSAIKGRYVDRELKTKEYSYNLEVLDENSVLSSVFTSKNVPTPQWFNTKKSSLLIATILMCCAILYYIYSAKSGKNLYIRKISGLESLDDAVGRATEMGQPILFVPGINDIDDMQTIAGLTILGKVAEKAAEYDAEIIVPVSRSMVLSTAREIVKEAFLKAGRPDTYKEDSIFYLTDDQFGYVAGVDGIILREKPAANFFLGAFYAESLILAETGFSSGAIQTAGTAMPSQLPFFVAACDYTLIGEELYAASAYLSREPNQLGSLKGQDFGKAAFIFVLIVGVILEIFNNHFLKDFLTNF